MPFNINYSQMCNFSDRLKHLDELIEMNKKKQHNRWVDDRDRDRYE